MPYRYDEDFKPSRPREAKGGIKAQSGRGSFGRSWWARRWIEALEGFDLGARLGRGRSYARQGQVLSIEIETGAVTAKVQGSRKRPYRVHVNVKTLDGPDWEKLGAALSERPVFAAMLLAGRMPEDIEDLFEHAGLSLFPSRSADLETGCSCPDWSNPCKHVAAVYLLLGEEFDRDPFLIFRLRGLEREKLAGLTARPEPAGAELAGGHPNPAEGAAAAAGGAGEHGADPVYAFHEALSPSAPEPLPADPGEFWGQANATDDFAAAGAVPPVSAALPKRLGSFPFWRGKTAFLPAMERIYRQASQSGLDAFLGHRQNPTRPKPKGRGE